MAMQPQKWSLSSLAVELGHDRRTLAKKLSDVPPFETKGKTKYWRLRDVVQAVEGTGRPKEVSESESAARARLTRARADIHEATASQLAGDLVPIDQIAGAWAKVLGRLKSALLAIPNQVAPAVEHTNNIEEIRGLVTKIVHDALDELANTEIEFEPDVIDATNGQHRPNPVASPGPSRPSTRRPNGASDASAAAASNG